jgi:PHAX RNA-binding domain-containing protein
MTTTHLTLDEICEFLGETEAEPRRLIQQIARRLGPVAVEALLDAVTAIEAQGGLEAPSTGQRRTPGGVFFALTKAGLSPYRARGKPPAPPRVAWAEALASLPTTLQKGYGKVKTTLVGRPKETAEVDTYVVFQLESAPPDSLPIGLPLPPTQGTLWTVFVAKKQWQTVAPALRRDPEDKLVLDGKPCVVEGQAYLFVTAVTTPGLSRAKRAAQQASA